MKLDWNKFFTMVIYGVPGSGKTQLLRSIIYSACQKGDFDNCLLFSSTKDSSDYDFLEPEYKFESYQNEVIDKYIQLMKKTNTTEIITRGLIIFDDCVGEQTFKSPLFQSLFSNYRHYGINIIVCMQMPVMIPLCIRSQIKYGCVYKYVNEDDREKIYRCFGGLCDSKNEFYKIYDKFTDEKYKFLFFNQTNIYDRENAYSGARAPAKKLQFLIKF